VPKQIILTIAPDGSPTLRTEGFSGSDCRKASKYLEDALGDVLTDKPTAESYTAVKAPDQLKQGT
jgi:hypothetical protein